MGVAKWHLSTVHLQTTASWTQSNHCYSHRRSILSRAVYHNKCGSDFLLPVQRFQRQVAEPAASLLEAEYRGHPRVMATTDMEYSLLRLLSQQQPMICSRRSLGALTPSSLASSGCRKLDTPACVFKVSFSEDIAAHEIWYPSAILRSRAFNLPHLPPVCSPVVLPGHSAGQLLLRVCYRTESNTTLA